MQQWNAILNSKHNLGKNSMTGKILLTFGALRDSSFIHPTGNRLCISYEFIFKMDSIQDRMKNYLHDLFSIVFLSANRKSHISLPFLSHIFFIRRQLLSLLQRALGNSICPFVTVSCHTKNQMKPRKNFFISYVIARKERGLWIVYSYRLFLTRTIQVFWFNKIHFGIPVEIEVFLETVWGRRMFDGLLIWKVFRLESKNVRFMSIICNH